MALRAIAAPAVGTCHHARPSHTQSLGNHKLQLELARDSHRFASIREIFSCERGPLKDNQ
eukprot:3939793-Pleurochrysis_carterae.AAC.1